MGEVTVENRGRILIPKEIRENIGIRGGEKLNIEEKDGEIVLTPASDKESVKELKGVVKDSDIDPLDVKNIWRE